MTSSLMRTVAGLLVLSAALPAGARGADSWLQPETLSTADTHNDAVDLATNSPGVAAAVWTEFANGRTPRFRLRVSTRAIDGAWAPSQQLSGAGEVGAGAVGVDPQGRITAVWDEAGKMMWASHAPGEPWTAAEPIPDGDGGNPDLFVASDGTATAVWQKGSTFDALVIRAARRPPGGAWSSVETISPTWSYRAHVEGDTAGNVTVSYTHDVPGGRYIYAVDRRNGGTWGTQSPLGGPVLADNVSELVVAPNSGQASVFWQNGNLAAPLAARTGLAGTWGPVTPISGSTPGRLDLSELDRAAADGTGLVTATWIAGRQVLTAYRSEATGAWAAPATPVAVDPGDGTTPLEEAQIASNEFGRAIVTWLAVGQANRFSLRGPGPGAPWSAPAAIDGVPADATPLDSVVDGTGRVTYAWGGAGGQNIQSLGLSTYGSATGSPQTPADPGPAPPTNPPPPAPPSSPPSGGGNAAGRASAALLGAPTTARGVAFAVTMPAAGSARLVFERVSGKAAAAGAKQLGTVDVKLKQGRNVVRVKRVKKRSLARGAYRVTITPKVGSTRLKPIKVSFKIRR